LLRRVDVEVLDLEPATGGVLQLVQRGAVRAANSRHDARSRSMYSVAIAWPRPREAPIRRTYAFSEIELMTARPRSLQRVDLLHEPFCPDVRAHVRTPEGILRHVDDGGTKWRLRAS